MASLADLVDVAIDTNRRVIYDSVRDWYAVVDGNNNGLQIDAARNNRHVVDGGAAKTFIASFNWDTSDERPELTFVDSSMGEIEYVRALPSSAVSSSSLAVEQTGHDAERAAGTACLSSPTARLKRRTPILSNAPRWQSPA